MLLSCEPEDADAALVVVATMGRGANDEDEDETVAAVGLRARLPSSRARGLSESAMMKVLRGVTVVEAREDEEDEQSSGSS